VHVITPGVGPWITCEGVRVHVVTPGMGPWMTCEGVRVHVVHVRCGTVDDVRGRACARDHVRCGTVDDVRGRACARGSRPVWDRGSRARACVCTWFTPGVRPWMTCEGVCVYTCAHSHVLFIAPAATRCCAMARSLSGRSGWGDVMGRGMPVTPSTTTRIAVLKRACAQVAATAQHANQNCITAHAAWHSPLPRAAAWHRRTRWQLWGCAGCRSPQWYQGTSPGRRLPPRSQWRCRTALR